MIQAEGYHPLLELQSLRLSKYFFFFLPFLISLPYSSHLLNKEEQGTRGCGTSLQQDSRGSTYLHGFCIVFFSVASILKDFSGFPSCFILVFVCCVVSIVH